MEPQGPLLSPQKKLGSIQGSGAAERVLVLRPGALGDTLLAVPALRALRKGGFAPLTLAAHGGAARLLASVGEVDRGLAFDDPSLGWLSTQEIGRAHV